MRIRSKIKKILRQKWESEKIYTPLHIRRNLPRWRDRLVSFASNSERVIFDLTSYANYAIITHMKAHEHHGNNAEIGDLVRIYSTTGFDTGIIGIVVEVREFTTWTMESWRRIRLNNSERIWDAHLARIISKAELNGRD